MKQAILARFAPQAYALLRIISGLAFAQHGAQKLFGVLGGKQVQLVSLYGGGAVIELVGGLLIAAGLLTSWAAFVSSGTMAVAYFAFHFPEGFWPAQNRGELAMLYCFVFLYVASRGDGIWSLAGLGRGRKRV